MTTEKKPSLLDQSIATFRELTQYEQAGIIRKVSATLMMNGDCRVFPAVGQMDEALSQASHPRIAYDFSLLALLDYDLMSFVNQKAPMGTIVYRVKAYDPRRDKLLTASLDTLAGLSKLDEANVMGAVAKLLAIEKPEGKYTPPKEVVEEILEVTWHPQIAYDVYHVSLIGFNVYEHLDARRAD